MKKIGKCLRLLSAVESHVTIRPDIYPLREKETVIKVVVEKTLGQFYVKRSEDWKKSVLKLMCKHYQVVLQETLLALVCMI